MTIATAATPQSNSPGSTDALLKKYATQLTAALAVVACVTGVMMFFGVFKHQVEAMHEWLGMAFVVAVILHLTRHRKPFAMMLTQGRMKILLIITALIATAFIALPSAKEGNPIKQTISAVLRAPISDVAPVLGVSTEEAVSRLTAAGAKNATPTQSIASLAQASKTDPIRLLNAIAANAEAEHQVEKD